MSFCNKRLIINPYWQIEFFLNFDFPGRHTGRFTGKLIH